MGQEPQREPPAQEGSLGQDSGVPDRRTFLSKVRSFAMVGGLVASYGTFAAIAGRFLFPAHPGRSVWLFVAEAERIQPGGSLSYTDPSGASVTITRQGESGTSADFLALSSVCPHLGCKVHWEPHNNRFFCPCHNGIFTPTGEAVEGPPAEADQSLPRYDLKIERGLLYIKVPLRGLAVAERKAQTPQRRQHGAATERPGVPELPSRQERLC